jgi:hypothetical protein
VKYYMLKIGNKPQSLWWCLGTYRVLKKPKRFRVFWPTQLWPTVFLTDGIIDRRHFWPTHFKSNSCTQKNAVGQKTLNLTKGLVNFFLKEENTSILDLEFNITHFSMHFIPRQNQKQRYRFKSWFSNMVKSQARQLIYVSFSCWLILNIYWFEIKILRSIYSINENHHKPFKII